MHSPAALFPLPEQKSKNEGILCKSPTYETGCGINYRFYLSRKAPSFYPTAPILSQGEEKKPG
jgi:hypothetical protein